MSGRNGAERVRLNTALVVGLSLCTLGFTVELRRGMGGHLPAWVYVLEWPLFAVTGTVMWWRLRSEVEPSEPGADPTNDGVAPQRAADEPDLLTWKEYVARAEAGENEL